MSHYSDAEDSISDFEPDRDGLRKRRAWDPDEKSITSEIKELLEEDVNSLVEEDCIGCPLPSTPEDENILDSEMSDVLKAAVLGTGSVELDFLLFFLFLIIQVIIIIGFSCFGSFLFHRCYLSLFVFVFISVVCLSVFICFFNCQNFCFFQVLFDITHACLIISEYL